jgi:hypothetical protein
MQHATDALSGVGTERYEVTALLGQGGMGAVYRAIDRVTGNAIALKRLIFEANEKRQSKLTELFHQEYRVLVRLSHPNVVRAHDFGSDERGPFYTMELLEGRALHELSPLPWREVCSLARDACSALALLHSRQLLHRDVSPKNVQRTADGRAKLLDFGAMTVMGPTKTLVGTPPFVPPEASLQQSLDGRSDLYALGGTIYFALTRRHAYPARTLADLPEFWRAPPAPPSTYTPTVPAALDALVLALLSREPAARPRNAAEVIDRLTSIADLPESEVSAESHAYVSTPELVGRGSQLARIRTRIKSLHSGKGGAMLIEGAEGSGRSRMLDTTVLDAKLSGITVVRASAADSASGRYGAVSVIAQQLWAALPEARRGEVSEDSLLALLLIGNVPASADNQRRAELQNAFVALLTAFEKVEPLLLAVDDIDRCDEASQAAFATVAQAFRRQRLLVAVSVIGRARHERAILVLREKATQIALRRFTPADTEALLGSVFGDVPYIHAVAARIHERAEGNPRGCMQLIQHLVTGGYVTYRMGTWILPADLDHSALPATLSDGRRMQLEHLSADARELAEMLAVAESSVLDMDAYLELTSHADRDRTRAALDELSLAKLLRSDGAYYAFVARVWPDELLATIDPDRMRQYNRRMAAVLAKRDADRLDIARYLWRAGDRASAIDTLIAELNAGSRRDRCPRDYAELLHGAAAACTELSRSPRERFLLLHEIVRLGHDLALPNMRARMAELFTQLRKDSGLDDWEQQDPQLEALPRLQLALQIAQQRWERTPEHERGLQPLEAVITLSRLVSDLISVAAQAGDFALYALLPQLDAFFPLSSVIARVQNIAVPASKAVVAGRYEVGREGYIKTLEALQTSREVDEELRGWAISALHWGIGCIEAGLGRKDALTHAEILNRVPVWRVPAWTIRRLYFMNVGNLREAERCRRQVELLLLQSPIKPPLYAGAAHQHVYAYVLLDNISGLRHAIVEMEAVSKSQPSLAPFVPFTRGAHARACGNHADALKWFDQTLSVVRPGEHPIWPWAASGRVHALVGLERYSEARDYAMGALVTADEIGLGIMRQHIEVALATAEAKLGDFAAACARLDAAAAAREALGMGPASLGLVYEARARTALWMNDAVGFDCYARKCATQYRLAQADPALIAKYERLMREARALELLQNPELAAEVAPLSSDTEDTTIVPETATEALFTDPPARPSLHLRS